MKESLYKKIVGKQDELIQHFMRFVYDKYDGSNSIKYLSQVPCKLCNSFVKEIAELKAELERKIDKSHLCCVCGENWVNADNGYDTCDYCQKYRI